jgi:hypothetical protein
VYACEILNDYELDFENAIDREIARDFEHARGHDDDDRHKP